MYNLKLLNIKRGHLTATHSCQFTKTSESCLPKLPPQAGKIRRFFRKFRKLLIVSRENAGCRETLPSHASVASERIRAYRLHKSYILHPFSKISIWRETLAMITWIVVFSKDPYTVAFMHIYHKSNNIFFNITELSVDFLIFFLHITTFIKGKSLHVCL